MLDHTVGCGGGERGVGGGCSARTMIVIHPTIRNDELDIRDGGRNKIPKKDFSGEKRWIRSMVSHRFLLDSYVSFTGKYNFFSPSLPDLSDLW